MASSPLPLLGTFHEASITVSDVRASVEFFERLGFSHATTNDTLAHPYGVLTDRRLFLGPHERLGPSPVLPLLRLRRGGPGLELLPHRRARLGRDRRARPLRACDRGARSAHLPSGGARAGGNLALRGLLGGEPAGRGLRRGARLLGGARLRRRGG